MRYSLEETLGEQAFIFLDKVHSPIFLVHCCGMIKKINRAGWKLLSLAHLSIENIEDLIRGGIIPKVQTKKSRLKVFATPVAKTEYTLIEIMR